MKCNLCPRNCNTDRAVHKGFCGQNDKIKIAKFMLHHWEEPCISGERGSGAVFFAGCNLKCVFCQNYEISYLNKGDTVSEEELGNIFLKLQDMGAHNINLVTPTHFTDCIKKVLHRIKHKLYIPVVYNCGGYESLQVIEGLKDYIDIYIQDIKYSDNGLAKLYSQADNYFETAKSATAEMIEQKGNLRYGEDGILKNGVIIRHLVLPGHKMNTYGVLDFISTLDKDKYILSLMSQFTPTDICEKKNILNKRVSKKEYELIVNYALKKNLTEGYIQELSSASKDFIPEF